MFLWPVSYSYVYGCTCRKELFTSVNFFIHLNLCIALLLAYVVFLAGMTTAKGNRVSQCMLNLSHRILMRTFFCTFFFFFFFFLQIGCAFVAVLLHYLFTAAFCWMLCEGIMLYLMLVVVFSSISKKWWLFLLIGWGKCGRSLCCVYNLQLYILQDLLSSSWV